MSSKFQPKRKELSNVKVVSTQSYGNNRKNYKLVGSVQRGYTAFVTTTRNKNTGKCSLIDDTSSLTKKTKGEIVKFFSDKENRNKGVAYLVLDKNKVSKEKNYGTKKMAEKNSDKTKRKK